jgi:ankyrin repeat protein
MSNNTIHAAAKCGDQNLLIQLLKEGVPVDTPNQYGFTPLILAASVPGSLGCVKILLAARADVNYSNFKRGTSPLHMATLSNNTNAVSLLLEAKANARAMNTQGDTPLYNAIVGISPGSVELLLDRKAELPARFTRSDLLPGWLKAILDGRKHCRQAVIALYGVLRKRYRSANNRIPKDMVLTLANYTYATRYNEVWATLPE